MLLLEGREADNKKRAHRLVDRMELVSQSGVVAGARGIRTPLFSGIESRCNQ